MSDNTPQNELFDESSGPTHKGASAVTADASLQAALGGFEQHMRQEGFALNTIKSFASDIRLLGKYLGAGQAIGEIATDDLNKFLNWLVYERGVPCSPKSYARRVTTLKVFFGWLQDAGILVLNPADAVVQMSVSSPLPTIPTEEQVDQAVRVAEAWRAGEDIHGNPRKVDTRPYVLLTLLLQTAMKKSEVMGLVLNHIERDDPFAPQIFVRYKNPRLRYKERKLAVEPEWLDALDEYVAQYEIKEELFTCTARNLEYVLRDVGDEAGLDRGLLSFENLRWTSALMDLKNDMDHELIREKLGLSKVTWRETKSKLERLWEKQKVVQEETDEAEVEATKV